MRACAFVAEKEAQTMDREHVKGAADKAKGSLKKTAGKAMTRSSSPRVKWIRPKATFTTPPAT